MKNTIYTSIHPKDFLNKSYLDYIASFSKYYSLGVHIDASVPLVVNQPIPTAVVGSGFPGPTSMVVEKSHAVERSQIDQVISYLDQKNVHVKATLNEGYSMAEKSLTDLSDGLLWITQIVSTNNLWNEVFGTPETELAKNVKMPCLCLPSGTVFTKPKKLLMIIRDDVNIDWDHFKILKNTLGFELTVAYYHEEDDMDVSIASIAHRIRKKLNSNVHVYSQSIYDSTIQEVIRLMAPDWIAYENFERSFVERFFKPNTNGFILYANKPILII